MTDDKADKGQWHGGKGSVQKPKDQDKFADGWDAIWGNKEQSSELTRREQVLLDPLEASKRSDESKKKDKE